MSTLDRVRALFVEGGRIECVDNTYHRERGKTEYIGKVWEVGKVGKTVWEPLGDKRFRGTFPSRAGDVLAVDETEATWKIGRDDHTVTYRRLP